MVVVLKKSGKVRICVDLKPLNKSVVKETHKVDDTLAKMAGPKVYSVKFGVLTDTTGRAVTPILHTLWKIYCTRGISEKSAPDFGRVCRIYQTDLLP